MSDEKIVCVTHADGSCTDVLIRNLPGKVQFEISHWFMGPMAVEIKKPHAKELLVALQEFIDRPDPEEAVVA